MLASRSPLYAILDRWQLCQKRGDISHAESAVATATNAK